MPFLFALVRSEVENLVIFYHMWVKFWHIWVEIVSRTISSFESLKIKP